MSSGAIFCMGGGGCTVEPGFPALDAYVLSLARTADPRVLFLPTASGDAPEYIAGFQRVFGAWPCRQQVLPLFDLSEVEEPVESLILGADVIYVGGGSLLNLLAVWRVHGVDDLLREAHRRGAVLTGVSAGAMCWLQGGVSRGRGALEATDGLGLLEGSLSVHADLEPDRPQVHREAIAAGRLPDGWSADEYTGLLFVDGRLQEVVASRAGAGARWVERQADGSVRETALAARLLETICP